MVPIFLKWVGQFKPKRVGLGKPPWSATQGVHKGKALRGGTLLLTGLLGMPMRGKGIYIKYFQQ